MTTKQIQYVITLAFEGSFSRASEVLNISQPSLSQYIKKIETELGIDLFDRSNGDVRLTDAGRVYIDSGRKILKIEQQMRGALSDIASYKTGSIVIGATPYRATSMLPSIARCFQSIYPGIHLVIREGTISEIEEGMKQGKYNLALSLFPIDERLFNSEIVMEEEMVLAVPKNYPLFPTAHISDRKYPAIEPEVLNRHKMVMLTEKQFMQKQLNNLILDYNLHVEIAAIVKSLEAQIEMVKAGVGMAFVPSGIERFCTDPSITLYSFIPVLPKRKVILIWERNRLLTKAEEELKNVIHSIHW